MITSKQTAMITSMALASFLFFGNAYAEDKTTAAQSHEEHHPDAKAQTPMKDAAGDMMGSMDMDGMADMMHECMQTHKDGKMCDHQMTSKCQEKMGKSECQKMMKQMKKKEKSQKK